MLMHENPQTSRLLAKLVRELLARDTFESLPDLTEALKCRCARLRIPWTPDDLNDAYRLVGSNTRLPGDQTPRRRVVDPVPLPPAFSRAEAARLVQQLTGARIRTISASAWTDPAVAEHELDEARQRAREMGIAL